ncbi:MAG: DUF1684 domain-containing protein [Acidobacteria bacterium]|nr:DUF1684 domain-containing protein [Acidobacteriota bacterium]
MKSLTFFVVLLALVFSVDAQSDYVKSVEKWRAAHEAELKDENGWLTVAGLFWLKNGVNTVGAGAGFDVELTENFKQKKFGTIDFRDGRAILKVEDGVEAVSDGKTVSGIELVSDEKGKPTRVETGSQTFYLIRREDRFGIRLKDKNYKARSEFKGLKWFPIDPRYKVEAVLEPYPEPKEILIPNMLGGNFRMKSPGVLRFELKGKKYALEPVLEEGLDELFIVFRDPTSRTETYGAGRFLYANKNANGRVELDFNKAENPPCAYTSFATCPLPPPQNRLPIAIKAGEKRYGKH